MRFLKNSVDGFKLIIGGYVIHLAFIITMIFFLGPPEYEE